MPRKNQGTKRKMAMENSSDAADLADLNRSHSVLVIKMGAESKLPNVDLQGRPALKYKEIKSVYQKTTPSQDIQASQSPSLLKDVVMDEPGELTLSQLKIRCRKPKPFEPMEADLDLDEPLISLKQRASKKIKSEAVYLERERKEEQPSTSSGARDSAKEAVEVNTAACSINEVFIPNSYDFDGTDLISHNCEWTREKEIPPADLFYDHSPSDMVEVTSSDPSFSQLPGGVENSDPIQSTFNLSPSSDSDENSQTKKNELYPEVDFPWGVNDRVIGEGIPTVDLDSAGASPSQPSINETVTMSAKVNKSPAGIHQDNDVAVHQSTHPPIKLLSNRKVLSPTSQEKLCQAVKLASRRSTGSPLNIDPVLKLSGLDPGKGKSNCTTSSPEKTSNRPKDGVDGPAKGILKQSVPEAVNLPAKKHTHEAITFSQRQMQDIELLATKLVSGLRSMKDVMEQALTNEESSPSSLKVNAEKMRTAIDDAMELEETTKKWLSMMGKDCNRFCKILRSTLQKTPNGLRKDRKKITFADEAGRMLCHVKIFEEASS